MKRFRLRLVVVLVQICLMMNTNNKIMVWNCRGAASSAFYRYFKIYVDKYKPNMLVIVKTRCDPSKMRNSLRRPGYDTFETSDN